MFNVQTRDLGTRMYVCWIAWMVVEAKASITSEVADASNSGSMRSVQSRQESSTGRRRRRGLGGSSRSHLIAELVLQFHVQCRFKSH